MPESQWFDANPVTQPKPLKACKMLIARVAGALSPNCPCFVIFEGGNTQFTGVAVTATPDFTESLPPGLVCVHCPWQEIFIFFALDHPFKLGDPEFHAAVALVLHLVAVHIV